MDPMNNDLVTFLRARYDEEAAEAQAAEKRTTTTRRMIQGQWVEDTVQPPEWRRSVWPPARVLAEVEAKRKSIARITNHAILMGWDEIHGDLLRLMATPYAVHPDYQDARRP